MARIPNPPKIDDDKSFIQYAAETILRFIIILWIFCQVVAVLFYALYHYTPIDFREFMFRDYLDFWDRWGDSVMPAWAAYIPTWKSPYVWAIIILLISLRLLRTQKKPSVRTSSKRKYSGKREQTGKAERKGDASSQSDDFEFDPSKFKKKKGIFHALKIWRDE